ncbi:MAG: GTPase HflX [Clostridiales bacterium]|nr:GTPase HflX [Clostridiales bacterium]
MIYGNIEGIRDSLIAEMERLYDMEFARDEFVPDRLLNLLVRFTQAVNRELMVYLGRDGRVLEIAVGSVSSVGLPELHLRRNTERLAGFRCIHTHPGGDARLSSVDEQALRLLRFDAMCAIGVGDNYCTGITAAFLGEVEYGRISLVTYGPVKPGRVPHKLWLREIELAEERVGRAIAEGGVVENAEKVMLISIDSDESLNELEGLADTAGMIVLTRVLQKRQKPDTATYIGSGKAEELQLTCQAMEIDMAIVDDELSAAQQRNLEAVLGVSVLDRTALILNIFARRAQTAEGKLQVELAMLKYRLPRLTGLGVSLSRMGAGASQRMRGPGETKLELDRRVIRGRIDDLNRELKELSRQRAMRRARREKQGENIVALVGYTNAGKSTLLNALSGSDVYVENKLFATLDPVLRQVELPENRSCLMVDTVGFINKLPHQLVEAFHSTLEEALNADLLVIVHDMSAPDLETQRSTVFEVLRELGAGGKPYIEAFNKVDSIKMEDPIDPPDAVYISAKTGAGLDRLMNEISSRIAAMRMQVELLVPYSKGSVIAILHDVAEIEAQEYEAEGTKVTCRIDAVNLARIQKMLEGK